jgi:hypothetical protein
MKNLRKMIIFCACFPAATALAVDSDAVIGGAIGGGVGAAVGSEVGGKEGAIVGSAVGAALGTAVMANEDDNHAESVHVEVAPVSSHPGGPPPHAYSTPPGHAKHGKKQKWK